MSNIFNGIVECEGLKKPRSYSMSMVSDETLPKQSMSRVTEYISKVTIDASYIVDDVYHGNIHELRRMREEARRRIVDHVYGDYIRDLQALKHKIHRLGVSTDYDVTMSIINNIDDIVDDMKSIK